MPVRAPFEIPCSLVVSLLETKPYPKELVSIGDYIRKERLDRNLSQSQVARMLDITTDTVTNWELNRNTPQVSYYPRIILFLGVFPFEKPETNLGNRVWNYRYRNGLSYKKLAKNIGIDEVTIKRVERNLKGLNKKSIRIINSFITSDY